MRVSGVLGVFLCGFILAASGPYQDPVVCCREARVFLESIGEGGPQATPVRLKPGKKQLFIDDGVLSESKGIRRALHQPAKFGAVLRADKPWEGTIQTRTGPSWNPDKKVWMLWYFGAGGTAYATSRDGIHWEKPVLGIVDYHGSKETNLLPEPLSFVIYDQKDPDSSRRYKAFTTKGPMPVGGSGFYPAVSSDGLRWRILDTFVPSQDEANLFHDEEYNLFVFTVKHPGPYGRSVYLTVSRDFVHWTDPRDCMIFHADKQDQDLGRKWIAQRFADPVLKHPEYNIPSQYSVQVYNMAVFRYANLYIGLPAMFHQTGRVSKDWEGFKNYQLSPEILQAVHSYGDWTGFHHLQMISSRNLVDWRHAGDRQPFIDESPVNTDAYDLQTIMPASPPVVHGDELWFYYTGLRSYAYVSSEHSDIGAICLAKLRLDGFVSMDASDAEGSVLTKPLSISGESLHANLSAPSGEMRAEVLDVGGHVVPGFSAQDSIPARGDSVDMRLKWRNAKVGSLRGKGVRLRFLLRNASLYAFWSGQ